MKKFTDGRTDGLMDGRHTRFSNGRIKRLMRKWQDYYIMLSLEWNCAMSLCMPLILVE